MEEVLPNVTAASCRAVLEHLAVENAKALLGALLTRISEAAAAGASSVVCDDLPPGFVDELTRRGFNFRRGVDSAGDFYFVYWQ